MRSKTKKRIIIGSGVAAVLLLLVLLINNYVGGSGLAGATTFIPGSNQILLDQCNSIESCTSWAESQGITGDSLTQFNNAVTCETTKCVLKGQLNEVSEVTANGFNL